MKLFKPVGAQQWCEIISEGVFSLSFIESMFLQKNCKTTLYILVIVSPKAEVCQEILKWHSHSLSLSAEL